MKKYFGIERPRQSSVSFEFKIPLGMVYTENIQKTMDDLLQKINEIERQQIQLN